MLERSLNIKLDFHYMYHSIFLSTQSSPRRSSVDEVTASAFKLTDGYIYQLLNVLPEVGMLPEALAEGDILTKGEQHACYMTEQLTRYKRCSQQRGGVAK